MPDETHNLFTAIKQLDWSSFNPGGKHANNCLLAQRVESGLIYTRFVKALVAAGITRFTTTHDAINVQAPDEESAQRIIEKEVRKAGLKLNLKTKSRAFLEKEKGQRIPSKAASRCARANKEVAALSQRVAKPRTSMSRPNKGVVHVEVQCY